jgi:hypothetical protein
MASFTDNPQALGTFNPYVQQLPVEAMVKVGMQKQEQYNQGIQKIQTAIDNISGLEVANDADKAYLQSKVNELGNKLKFVAAGDFSDFQLVNSVNGMTNQLVYDPIVQTAVGSAAKRKKEIELMEEARKKGELVPDNEVYFAKRDNEWLNSIEPGKAYSTKYVPYFDVFKFAKEKIDALKLDGFSFDEIYQKGSDGQYLTDGKGNLILNETMKRIKEEGYLPGKLQATMDEVFSDGRVKQQLGISGEYFYRNSTPEDLASLSTESANTLKNKYEDQLDILNLKLQANPDNSSIKEEIKKTEDAILKIGENLLETGKLISENPDAVKSYLYTNNKKENYMSIFNVSKKYEEIMQSPAYQVKIELQKMANEQSRFSQQEARLRWQFSKEHEQRERFKKSDQETKLAEARIKAGVGIGTGIGADGFPTLSPDLEPSTFNALAYHAEKVTNAANNFSNSQAKLVWQSLWNTEKNKSILKREMTKTVNGQPITEEEAIKNIITRWAKSKGVSYDDYMVASSDKVLNQYNSPESIESLQKNNYALYNSLKKYEDAQVNWKIEKAKDDDVKANSLASFYKELESLNIQDKKIKIGNESYTLTKQDAIDLAAIAKYEDRSFISALTSNEESEALKKLHDAAKIRLEKAGKSRVINAFLNSFPGEKKAKSSLDLRTSYPFQGVAEGIEKMMFGRTQTEKEEAYRKQKIAGNPFEDVYRAMGKINPETITNQVENASKVISKYRKVVPNLSGSLSTGDDKTDKVILQELKTTANQYAKNRNMVGVDADKVVEAIQKMENIDDFRNETILRGVEKIGAKPVGFIQIGDNKLYLNDPESVKFRVNPESIYEDDYITAVEEIIESNLGTSSYGDINKINTYRENDVVMKSSDFPFLNNSKYSAKVNFLKSDNMYYPYLYINDGKKEKVVPLPVNSPYLGKLMREDLPSYVSPKIVEQLLNSY